MNPKFPSPEDCLPKLTAEQLLQLIRVEAFKVGAVAMRLYVSSKLSDEGYTAATLDAEYLWPDTWGEEPAMPLEPATPADGSGAFEVNPPPITAFGL
jgi:hypothetical protein